MHNTYNPHNTQHTQPAPSKEAQIEQLFTEIFKELDIDLNNPHFSESPKRLTNYFLEKTKSLRVNFSDSLTGNATENLVVSFKKEANKLSQTNVTTFEKVVIKDVYFTGTCPHHFLPIFGKAKISYFPKGSVLGLSKFSRILNSLSEGTPLTQEDLTQRFHACLVTGLNNKHILVKLKATHTCMTCRGAKAQGSKTVTVCKSGKFL